MLCLLVSLVVVLSLYSPCFPVFVVFFVFLFIFSCLSSIHIVYHLFCLCIHSPGFTSLYIVLHRFYHVCNPLFPMFPSFDYTVFHYYFFIRRVHLSAILLRAPSTVQIIPSVVSYLVLQLNRIQPKSYSVQVQIYADRRANHCLFLHSAF